MWALVTSVQTITQTITNLDGQYLHRHTVHKTHPSSVSFYKFDTHASQPFLRLLAFGFDLLPLYFSPFGLSFTPSTSGSDNLILIFSLLTPLALAIATI